MKKSSASSTLPRVTKRDFARSSAAARAVRAHQAHRPPEIIRILRALLNRESCPPGHVQWVEDGVRSILKNWEHSENLVQLRSDLGVGAGEETREKELTRRRETAIAAAIVDAALAGEDIPKKAAVDEMDVELRQVQRAWKKWGPVHIQLLRDKLSQASGKERAKIRAAIKALGDKK
jgi:hypothetical protein